MKTLFCSCLIIVALPAWAWAGNGPSLELDLPSKVVTIGAMIMCVVELLRSPRLGGLVERIPRRWRIVVPVVLSGIAGILSIVGGVSWREALYIGLFAGPMAVFAHEAVVESILGHASRREERASAAPVPVEGPFRGQRGP